VRKLTPRRRAFLNRKCRLARVRVRPIKRRKRATRLAVPLRDWQAPAVLCLITNRTTLLHSLEELRRLFHTPSSAPIHLDFSRVTRLNVEGFLLVVAELQRCVSATYGRHPLTCTHSLNDKVCQVFEQIELGKFLGTSTGATPADDDVVHWRFVQGRRVEGEKYEAVLSDFNDELPESMQESLFIGITEAMTNVANHADELPRADGFSFTCLEKWWMFSQYRDGRLTVTFCDLGAGIPRTLPIKRPALAKLMRSLGWYDDANAIRHSIKDSISRTQEDHRGKGLGQIARLVDSTPGAFVNILSNSGVYGRSAQISGGVGHKLRNYRDSIFGTMIVWSIPIQKQEES
jgi:hypothetical protein